ncbi:MAG TPA: hypothetical protein VEO36_07710 [Casimicrobiaceae bacterium]|nr:hypothetical protein [Casimicrobiaceae bacterium]
MKNEIEMLEPRIRIVGHRVRWLGHRAIVANDNALRSQGAEMKPDRRRAWTAVEHEADWPARRHAVREKVRRGEYRCLGLAALLVQAAGRDRNEFSDCVVLQRAAVDDNAAVALAHVLGKELVDFLAQALLRVVVAGSSGRFGHGSTPFANVLNNAEPMAARRGILSSIRVALPPPVNSRTISHYCG